MKVIEINKGLNLPIAGEPLQQIEDAPEFKFFALCGQDYVGMRPQLFVNVGDKVQSGQPLFEDKKNPGVLFTSPCSGTIQSINRGDRRVFRSVVIERNEKETNDGITFEKFAPDDLVLLQKETVCKNLIQSGLWTALRTRPFSQIPAIGTTPHSLFVTAIDTSPLAPDPVVVINERKEDFLNGLKVLKQICGRKMYVCVGKNFPTEDIVEDSLLEIAVFNGPHPAGLPGTHIHFLDPVGPQKTVWQIGYQDVIAIGQLFTTGKFPTERVISLAGPVVKKPRLLRTRLGTCTKELVVGELVEGRVPRVISGSVLAGRAAEENGLLGMGRYHNQISVIEESVKRTFLEWMYPGFSLYSMTRTIISSLLPSRKFAINTAVHGGHRAIFPVRQYGQVMPLDLMPVYLFRALEMGNIEQCEALGCLELDEEDLALCTFVDPGKNDYGRTLREMLTKIQKEG